MHTPHLWRYATKKFDVNKNIPNDTLNSLLEVLRMSPSSFGLQPWKWILIRDAGLRKELRQHAWDQPQITEASELIVFCAKTSMNEQYVKDFVRNIAETRQVNIESLAGYEQMMLNSLRAMNPQQCEQWMRHQVYIALGFFLNECAHRQIDACPMEGFDGQAFDHILKLNDLGLHATVLCALGYRAVDDPYATLKKVRFPSTEIIDFK